MKNAIIVIVLLVLTTRVLANSELQYPMPLAKALSMVESSNNPDAVGDDGKAIGPFQIWQVYHEDSGVPGAYERVKEWGYALRVVTGYSIRYAKKALLSDNYRELALCHHYGSSWKRKQHDPDGYWPKVRAALRKQ